MQRGKSDPDPHREARADDLLLAEIEGKAPVALQVGRVADGRVGRAAEEERRPEERPVKDRRAARPEIQRLLALERDSRLAILPSLRRRQLCPGAKPKCDGRSISRCGCMLTSNADREICGRRR